MEAIRITFKESKYIHPYSGTRGRPPVEFSTSTCSFGSTVTVQGHSKGGWVWANVFPMDSDQFEHLLIEGGTVKLMTGFSGDDMHCEFEVTHDGKASEIVITWNTRAD